MSALIGYGGAVVLVAVAVIATVMLRRRRRSRRSAVSQAEPMQTDVDATGYVPGVWLLGGAESAAPSHHAHGSQHGNDPGGSHSGTGDSGGGHARGGGH